MSLTRFIWHHRKAALTVVFILCLVGIYFAGHLPVAIFPQLTVPRIVISADAGDIPTITTLNQLTRPLEAAVSSVPGVSRVLSTTTRGSDGLDVTFAWGTDMNLALQRVDSQVAEIRPSLPPSANVVVALINPSLFPIMGYSLTSTRYSMTELRNIAMYTLRPRLVRLPGVAMIRVTGGDEPEYLVSVRPEALAARGLTLQDVEDALAKANTVASVGRFDRSYQRYEVLVSGLLKSGQDIGDVTVATRNGVPIVVSDLGTVERTIRPRTILASGNGKPSVVVNVIKQPDANTIQVADETHAELARLRQALPPGVNISMFYDQSQIVHESEASVVESIVIGGLLALVVLMIFLGNLRAAAVALTILPLSILITFGLMKAMGETLNIMTLGALAIALGLVIDDGIVVVENMFHELEMGKSRREAIAAGLEGITPAMIGSSLTTMVAFFPLTFLTGVTGQFFAPLALVMIATLFVSLLLALLLTPVMAEFLLRGADTSQSATQTSGGEHKKGGFLAVLPRAFQRLTEFYAGVFRWCLERPAIVLLCLIPVAILSYLLFTHLQTGFFPEFDEGAFVIDYRTPAGTSLTETNHTALLLEGMLAKTPEVSAWSRLTGAKSGTGLELTEQNEGDILVRLKKRRSRSAQAVMTALRHQIEAGIPGLQVDFAQILQDGIGDIAGSPSPIEVKLYGEDMATLSALARQAGKIVTKVQGVVDENDGIVNTGPEVVARVDSRRASRYGLTTDAVTAAAQAALYGTVVTTIQKGEQTVGVRVRATQPSAGMNPGILPNVPIAAPAIAAAAASGAGVTGGTVPLQSIASLTIQPGSPQIVRENQQQMISLTARLEGRDLGSAMKEIQSRLGRELHLPPGYRIEYGGLYASQQESFRELAMVLVLAFLLVTTLLVIQFRSFRQALSLLAAAVLSLFGVVLGLYVTGTPLNISSFTGAVMIVGIVTENGIVLFDFYNHLCRAHPEQSILDLMVEAGRMRIRPILMTTIGAILALFPLSLGLGAGAAMQKPLAIAVIGGLTVSAVFTLIVAPVLFVATQGAHGPMAARLSVAEDDFAAVEEELDRDAAEEAHHDHQPER